MTLMSKLTDRRTVLKSIGLGLAAPAILRTPAFGQEVTEITAWTWTVLLSLDEFHATHPHIKVNVVPPGATAQYQRIRNAIAAGQGLPDVVQIEYFMLPSMRFTQSLTDLGALGAKDYDGRFVDWAWEQVNEGGRIDAMPWDNTPLVYYYRDDVFQQYGLKPAATWDEFIGEARKLKSQTSDISLAVLPSGGPAVNALLWQAGVRPYGIDGTTVTLALNGEAAKAAVVPWQTLIDEDLVSHGPIYNAEWFAAVDAGIVASVIVVSWAARGLQANGNAGIGKWRAAPAPKLVGDAGSNWGGSTMAIMESSTKKEAAFEFVSWMLGSIDSQRIFASQNVFPALKDAYLNDEIVSAPSEFFGGQPVKELFRSEAGKVASDFRWSPFQDYVDAQIADEFAQAEAKKITLSQALDNAQQRVVAYAKDQGFTVVEA